MVRFQIGRWGAAGKEFVVGTSVMFERCQMRANHAGPPDEREHRSLSSGWAIVVCGVVARIKVLLNPMRSSDFRNSRSRFQLRGKLTCRLRTIAYTFLH